MRSLPARLTVAALCLAALPAAQARTLAEAKASGTLKIATSADFEPFNYLRGGSPAGFEVDLGEAVAHRLGLQVQWVVRPFDGLLRDLAERPQEIDLVIASHAITSTRQQSADFSAPHYCTGGVILTRAGGPLTSKTLAGKNLGAEAGSTYFGFLRKLPFQKTVQVYPSSQAAIQAVATGQVDAIATDRFAALDALKTFPKAKLVVGDTLWKEQIGMAFAKGNDDLRQAVNTALKQIVQDGTYAKLSRQYFGQDIGC
ncbi:amino acid ABC transporter substrate-binding protein [Deinococcus metallilatus]|uniref:Amino acid ABC transporter substrate-binding protein n=1 Tax=Deinococcus metallilatus TaxID=1211322 RepID=A0AAJ5F413_9DEIO|nr:ABC transporter substrate-binding protein [Deinococcus metallilatus]MBB5295921.1 polar amino acid transport system substrate-binding protein [Deinococcus metallilatus]QBY08245.1 amino acid ABC transporter substrate-binding protein [Deinococcus metallilatus]RXJ11976.1 amino acid ABC transporter substrate-binding protein [Deinococcus metallilatus]TLK25792.1 amino acid ABC transporter substrate-binding protein [Deinococcus metallilatus]GMA14544.1 amino acid ABC transporter substrate-binding pr